MRGRGASCSCFYVFTHPSICCPADKADVLVHARTNAARNRLLYVGNQTSSSTPCSAASTQPLAAPPQQQQQQQQQQQPQGLMPPPGRAAVMPLDWCAPGAAEAATSVRAAMGGPLDLVRLGGSQRGVAHRYKAVGSL